VEDALKVDFFENGFRFCHHSEGKDVKRSKCAVCAGCRDVKWFFVDRFETCMQRLLRAQITKDDIKLPVANLLL
jgi:hypothetical protein